MSTIPVHASPVRTLRHWTIDSQGVGGGSLRPSRPLPFTEPADGGRFLRLASQLTRVKSDLARRIR